MDRGAWRATVCGITRVRHDLATTPPPLPYKITFKWFWKKDIYIVHIYKHTFYSMNILYVILHISTYIYYIYIQHTHIYRYKIYEYKRNVGLPWWLSGKKMPANVGDTGSISGWGRSPEGGNGNLLQYSCLDNPMDFLAGYSLWGFKESDID